MSSKDKKSRKRTGIKEQMRAAKKKAKQSKLGAKGDDTPSSPTNNDSNNGSLSDKVKSLESRVAALEQQNKRLLAIFAKTFAQLSGGAVPDTPIIGTDNTVGNGVISNDNDNKDDEKGAEAVEETASLTKKSLRWMFQSDHKVIINGDNGSSAQKPKYKSGTVKFGKPVGPYKDGDRLQRYSVTFDTNSTGNSSSLGFGIAHGKFSGLVGSNWGDNGCAYIKGNGQFITSDMYRDVDDIGLEQKQTIETFKSDGFFKEGDEMNVVLDIKECTAIITNTKNNKSIKLGFPKTRDMGIIVYMGGSAMKKLRVKEQCSY